MTVRFGCALLVIAALLSSTSLVIAQPDVPPKLEDPDKDQNDEDEAKRLYGEADAHYAAGRYDKAVDAFSKAYELSGKAELLFNIANAYERNGDYQEAADHLKKYGASAAAADISSINERIKRLETNAAEKQQREIEEAKRATEVPAPEPKAKVEPKRPIAPPPKARETRSRTPGWVFLGVGAAVFAGGAVTGVVARSSGNDARDLCTDNGVCPKEASDDLDRERNLGIIADISMGVGVAAVGVGLYFVLRGGASNEDATITLSPSSDGAAVSYVGRF